ncbi:MAG: hypothetical protein WEB88_05020 [Gemmatimonadota bacterium]
MLLTRPLAALAVLTAAACAPPGQASTCGVPERIAQLPSELDEASGITAGRARPDVLWVHNDSEGRASLYALDAAGALVQTVRVPDVPDSPDWEDIEAGPCGPEGGHCLWIADIGDNRHDRADRALLRIPEPAPGDTVSQPPERFPIAYPDAPADAEAFFLLPGPEAWLITKGRTGPVAVYRYPTPLRADQPVTLEKVQELTEGLVQIPDMVTGAAATADGGTVAVRTYSTLRLYHLVDGRMASVGDALDLTPLDEFQGEGVTLLPDGTVYLVSERGLERNEAPPLSRATCRLE